MKKTSFIEKILNAILPSRRTLALGRELETIKADILADGRIDYTETTRLLTLIEPYVRLHDANAVKLQELLVDVREDGKITDVESELVIGLLDLIAERFAELKSAE